MFKERNVFIVGIKGVAMTNLALYLKKIGCKVRGSDIEEEFITDELLKENNIEVLIGFNKQDLSEDTELVIYSAAHNGKNNPQVVIAESLGIKVAHQVEIINQIMMNYQTKLAVCGCHGKTTTSLLLTHALRKLGQNPDSIIGVPNFEMQKNYNKDEKYFIVEADEYGINPPTDIRPKFDFLKPTHIIATNIDFDHPDVYKNLLQIKNAFINFFKDRKLFLCADDKNLMLVTNKLNKSIIETYGYNIKSNLIITEPKINNNGSTFNLIYKKNFLGNFSTNLFGRKNISNTAAVVLLLLNLGFKSEKIRYAIKDFNGARRRFEKQADINNIPFYDDYAHHPEEIKITISTARELYNNRRIIVVFQPHTYSRTQMLFNKFIDSLSLADISLLLPIYSSARETSKAFNVSSKKIEIEAKKRRIDNILACKNNCDLLRKLKEIIKPSDVLITMGAGNVYKLKDEIIKIISNL